MSCSTGGIIALALAVKRWSIDKCIYEFKRLSDRAFTSRMLGGGAASKFARFAARGSWYKSKPLREALRETLGTLQLFGGQKEDYDVYSTKVAVTTCTTGRGGGDMIVSNYCRKGGGETYQFLRAQNPDDELTVCEAGAATSAAFPYFKPFIHELTGKVYLDGAFYNNNPVNIASVERKFLWPDVGRQAPDIFLSIGTARKYADPPLERYVRSRIRRYSPD
jgi:predicted acylesterase/phospholipase RssA